MDPKKPLPKGIPKRKPTIPKRVVEPIGMKPCYLLYPLL